MHVRIFIPGCHILMGARPSPALTSYTPTGVSTGITYPDSVCDMHTWTIEDGKVSALHVRWGDVAALDSLFGAAVAHTTPHTVIIGAPSTGGDTSWPLVFVSS
jgi:hypothetical protein